MDAGTRGDRRKALEERGFSLMTGGVFLTKKMTREVDEDEVEERLREWLGRPVSGVPPISRGTTPE